MFLLRWFSRRSSVRTTTRFFFFIFFRNSRAVQELSLLLHDVGE